MKKRFGRLTNKPAIDVRKYFVLTAMGVCIRPGPEKRRLGWMPWSSPLRFDEQMTDVLDEDRWK